MVARRTSEVACDKFALNRGGSVGATASAHWRSSREQFLILINQAGFAAWSSDSNVRVPNEIQNSRISIRW